MDPTPTPKLPPTLELAQALEQFAAALRMAAQADATFSPRTVRVVVHGRQVDWTWSVGAVSTPTP